MKITLESVLTCNLVIFEPYSVVGGKSACLSRAQVRNNSQRKLVDLAARADDFNGVSASEIGSRSNSIGQ